MRLGRRGQGAPSLDLLVAGLGNPGRTYASDRHNVGFRVLDEVVRRHAGSYRQRFSGDLADLRLGSARVALLKPGTFMNDSGRPVAEAVRFYKLPVDRLLVVHDEIELGFGIVRARAGGGLGGHNGLRSVARALGTQDFLRLRVGVGRPVRGDPRPVADYVLSPFADHEDVEPIVTVSADEVERIAAEHAEPVAPGDEALT